MSIFKRIRGAAEAVGVLPMDVAGETKLRNERAANMAEANKAVIQAEAALDSAYINGQVKDIPALESALADAKVNAQRAQRAHLAAEQRLATAQSKAAEQSKAEAIKLRDAALDRRRAFTVRMGELAVQMAEARKGYDEEHGALAMAAAAGVAARAFYINGDSILHAALVKAGAIESQYSRHLADAPSAVDVDERARGAALAIASSAAEAAAAARIAVENAELVEAMGRAGAR